MELSALRLLETQLETVGDKISSIAKSRYDLLSASFIPWDTFQIIFFPVFLFSKYSLIFCVTHLQAAKFTSNQNLTTEMKFTYELRADSTRKARNGIS
jgi:hypothetical protein